jgi:hypothetical protein
MYFNYECDILRIDQEKYPEVIQNFARRSETGNLHHDRNGWLRSNRCAPTHKTSTVSFQFPLFLSNLFLNPSSSCVKAFPSAHSAGAKSPQFRLTMGGLRILRGSEQIIPKYSNRKVRLKSKDISFQGSMDRCHSEHKLLKFC